MRTRFWKISEQFLQVSTWGSYRNFLTFTDQLQQCGDSIKLHVLVTQWNTFQPATSCLYYTEPRLYWSESASVWRRQVTWQYQVWHTIISEQHEDSEKHQFLIEESFKKRSAEPRPFSRRRAWITRLSVRNENPRWYERKNEQQPKLQINRRIGRHSTALKIFKFFLKTHNNSFFFFNNAHHTCTQ